MELLPPYVSRDDSVVVGNVVNKFVLTSIRFHGGSIGSGCYVLVKRSARRELDGYDFDALHAVLEAYASDTL